MNCFVLISGFFLIKSKTFKLSKLVKLWLQLLFYSISISVIFAIFFNAEFSVGEWYKIVTPVVSQIWWFATTYVCLFILSPFINKMILNISQKEHLALIIVLTIAWSVIPWIFKIDVEYNNLLWFIYLYAVAAYISLHHFGKGSVKKYFVIAISAYAFMILTNVMYDYVNVQNSILNYLLINPSYFIQQNSIPILIFSVSLLLMFKNMDIKYNKIINIIASSVFGIYLIHDHPLVRRFLFDDVFNCSSHTNDPYLIPYVFLMCILIFTVCSIIELIRIYLIERMYYKKMTQVSDNIQEKISKWLDNIIKNHNT